MEIGKIGVLTGLVLALCTLVTYVLALRGSKRALYTARGFMGLTAATTAFCFFRLMWIVCHKQYAFEYVYKYTSPDLQYPFLAAATWAGQEGSFLLWALWTGIIGCLVAWKAGKWEARIMPIYVSAIAFLMGILVWLSPYAAAVKPPNYPSDLPWPATFGMGLNPSLQNYWMAIHPPTIFFGFASLLVPFSYAIAALIWHEYESWAGRVMPWVLMTVATLGVGLFMGGYWAYETQGWHGFWGWDPVENASLFPWLGALALLHGLVVQKSKGGMGKTNVFLAILSWLLFLYGTFLTRSGVLSDASVHAFDMIKKSALILILVMIGTYGIGGLALLAVRWRRIPARPISDKALSRDTAMVIAVSLMIFACIVIAVGSSWPMISKWAIIRNTPFLQSGGKGGALQPIFFNKFGISIIIPTLIIMGMVPFLAWGKTNTDKFLWKILGPWFTAIGAGICVLWYVWSQSSGGFKAETPAMVVVGIGTLGIFTAVANSILAWRVLKAKAVTMGGWLAHVGIGMIMFATVITNVYEDTKYKTLFEGDKPVDTGFGYSLRYAGWTHDKKLRQAEQETDPRVAAALRDEIERHDQWQFNHGVLLEIIPHKSEVGVAHADSEDESKRSDGFIVTLPVFKNVNMQMSAQPGDPTNFKWPYIKKDLFRDFYVLAVEDPTLERVAVSLSPGETMPIPATKYSVTYKKFFMNGGPGTAGTMMGGEMELRSPDGKTHPFKVGMLIGDEGGPRPVPAQIPAIQGAAILKSGPDPATKAATVAFELPEAPAIWKVTVGITNKPMINFVWLGVMLMGLGTICAMVRRSLEARKGALMVTAVAAGVGDVPIAIPDPEPNGSNGKNGAHTRHKPPKGAKAKISVK